MAIGWTLAIFGLPRQSVLTSTDLRKSSSSLSMLIPDIHTPYPKMHEGLCTLRDNLLPRLKGGEEEDRRRTALLLNDLIDEMTFDDILSWTVPELEVGWLNGTIAAVRELIDRLQNVHEIKETHVLRQIHQELKQRQQQLTAPTPDT